MTNSPGEAFQKKSRKKLPGVSDVTETFIPIYVPDSKGNVALQVGAGRLEDGKLVIEFDNSVSSVAIQRMISRKLLLGLSFVAYAHEGAPENPDESSTEESKTEGEN